MENALEARLGNRTAARLMLYLFHNGEAYAELLRRLQNEG
jgi:hypothetical protein